MTLITSAERLLPRQTESLSSAAEKVLKKKNVKIIYNDKVDLSNVDNFKANKITTKNGKQIEFEAFFICVGSKPCTDIVKKSLPQWLDENGFVKVDEYLNVITG